MKYLTAANWKQLGVALGIVTFVVVAAGLAPFIGAYASFLPGIIAGIAVHAYCEHRSQTTMELLAAPELDTYKLPKHLVIKTLIDTVPQLNVNMPQVRWILQWKNDMKGEMKFRLPYELPSAGTGQKLMEKQEVTLDVYLTTLEGNTKTAVKLLFETPTIHFKQIEVANNMITLTREAIDYQLKIEEAKKA